MTDDVPDEVKSRRLQEVISMFRTNIQIRNDELEVGKLRLLLVEGESRRSKEGARTWGGRTDQNKRVVFPISGETPECWSEESVRPILNALNRTSPSNTMTRSDLLHDFARSPKVEIQAGDYALVQVDDARGHTLRGKLMWRTSMQGFHEMGLDQSDLGLFGSLLTK
jgi:hypothetical protein